MAGGEDRNGIEVLKKLYRENEGGAEQVALAGLRRFHQFPACPLRGMVVIIWATGNTSRINMGTTCPTSRCGQC